MAHTNEERYVWLREALFAAGHRGDEMMLDRLLEADSPSTIEEFDAAIDRAIDYGNP